VEGNAWEEEQEGGDGERRQGWCNQSRLMLSGFELTIFWPLNLLELCVSLSWQRLETTLLQCKSVCIWNGHTHYQEAWMVMPL